MAFYVIQTIMGLLGSVGFAVLFGIYDRKLFRIAAGSAAGWAVYLVCAARGCSLFMALFVSSLFITALSEILARFLKTPVILLLVPILIPEIPGADLYYTMYYLVQGLYTEFGGSLNKVMTEAGAIALGIILVSHMARFLRNIHIHMRERLEGKRN